MDLAVLTTGRVEFMGDKIMMVLPYNFFKNGIKLNIDPKTDLMQVSALKITSALVLRVL